MDLLIRARKAGQTVDAQADMILFSYNMLHVQYKASFQWFGTCLFTKGRNQILKYRIVTGKI